MAGGRGDNLGPLGGIGPRRVSLQITYISRVLGLHVRKRISLIGSGRAALPSIRTEVERAEASWQPKPAADLVISSRDGRWARRTRVLAIRAPWYAA